MSTITERARAVAGILADRVPHPQPEAPVHPARAHIHATGSLGERVADGMAAAVGSWPFVIGQSCFILLWVLLNTLAFVQHWDPYPWILLNLCMSTQAMYTGPILLLASNRQAAKDRARDDTEAREVEQSSAILAELRELTRELHTHTKCVGHTTVESDPKVAREPAAATPTPRKRKAG